MDAAGREVPLPDWFRDCLPKEPGTATATGQGRDSRSCVTELDERGYRQLRVLQPASRFWPLQWAETGLFLGLAGVLTGFSSWWTRRRLS